MPGVVSLLDDRHAMLVEQIWADLAREFGLRDVGEMRHPHLSFHVADGYEREPAAKVLERSATAWPPLMVTVEGLGIFPGPTPVVYLTVARSAVLSRFHEPLWRALEPLSTGSVAYYSPDTWVPHVTLAAGDVAAEAVPPLIAFLLRRDLVWEMPLINVCLLDEAYEGINPAWHFALTGPAAAP